MLFNSFSTRSHIFDILRVHSWYENWELCFKLQVCLPLHFKILPIMGGNKYLLNFYISAAKICKFRLWKETESSFSSNFINNN